MPTHYVNITELEGDYDHIYCSPHLDDAALSCGGMISRQSGGGARVLIVTVCAGAPAAEGPFSLFAQENHARWGLAPATVVAQRIREDIMALELLGCDGLLLGALDAIYRLPEVYVNDQALFGAVAATDPLALALAPALAALVARFPQAIFYAPLGVGNHVDHQIVHQAMAIQAAQGAMTAFYEDFPYANLATDAVAARLAALGGAEHFAASTVAIDSTLARKISAIAAYTSQISTLFGDNEGLERAVTAYAAHIQPDEGRYGERIWLWRA